MRFAAEEASNKGSSAKEDCRLQLPVGVPVVVMSDASDAKQAAAVAAVLGTVAVAIDVEWPCDAWEGSGCASIIQASAPSPLPCDASLQPTGCVGQWLCHIRLAWD